MSKIVFNPGKVTKNQLHTQKGELELVQKKIYDSLFAILKLLTKI